ncbi:MAG: AtpZ/AtpI family protein [Flavobacteriaceae bacterium]
MEPQRHRKGRFASYARYSGIVFQMLAIIVVGTFVGVKLDEKYPNENNLFTVGLSLIAVIVSVIYVIRRINATAKSGK